MKTTRFAAAPVLLLVAGLASSTPGSLSAQAAGATPLLPPAESDPTEFDPYAEGSVAEAEGAVYARIHHLEGEVVLRRDGTLHSDLLVNDPVIPADGLATHAGRVEVQLADGTFLRLDRDTTLDVMDLADNTHEFSNTTLIQISEGALIIRADTLDSKLERFQIDTPDVSVFLLSDGLYRIDVRPGDTTVVASRSGALEAMSQGVSTIVRGGERIFARSGRPLPEPQIYNTLQGDDFDAWSAARDEALLLTVAPESVPPTLPEPVRPYERELTANGEWLSTPEYGWVWSPRAVAPDWQPYVYGHWAWSPAGMIWVSTEPWGWAPYHYGRWDFMIGVGWIWIPGWVYGGAHVAWVYSPGYFGWCPLGYYNYPVHISVNFGHYHSPWVYVYGHHVYHHQVHTVVIKEKTIIHEIERDYVIVDRTPRIQPNDVKTRPRLAEEMHRRVARRPDLQLNPLREDQRQVSFRDSERRRILRGDRTDAERLRSAPSGSNSTGRAGAGRVNAAPGTPAGTRAVRTRPQRTSIVPPATPTTPNRGSGNARRVETRTTESSGDSVPRRVLPRIVPGGRTTSTTGSARREAAPRSGAGTPGARSADPGTAPGRGRQAAPATNPRTDKKATPQRKDAKDAKKPARSDRGDGDGKSSTSGESKQRAPRKEDKDGDSRNASLAPRPVDRSVVASRRSTDTRQVAAAGRTVSATGVTSSTRRPSNRPTTATRVPGRTPVTATSSTGRSTGRPGIATRVPTTHPARPSVARTTSSSPRAGTVTPRTGGAPRPAITTRTPSRPTGPSVRAPSRSHSGTRGGSAPSKSGRTGTRSGRRGD